jgi:hypothetical protein
MPLDERQKIAPEFDPTRRHGSAKHLPSIALQHSLTGRLTKIKAPAEKAQARAARNGSGSLTVLRFCTELGSTAARASRRQTKRAFLQRRR